MHLYLLIREALLLSGSMIACVSQCCESHDTTKRCMISLKVTCPNWILGPVLCDLYIDMLDVAFASKTMEYKRAHLESRVGFFAYFLKVEK